MGTFLKEKETRNKLFLFKFDEYESFVEYYLITSHSFS